MPVPVLSFVIWHAACAAPSLHKPTSIALDRRKWLLRPTKPVVRIFEVSRSSRLCLRVPCQGLYGSLPSDTSIHLPFRHGRRAANSCEYARGRMADPEQSCGEVARVLVEGMGLTWEQATALMGVHTIGRARCEGRRARCFCSEMNRLLCRPCQATKIG